MPPSEEGKTQRISLLTGILMVILALFLDAIQFLLELIPVAGIILGWFIAALAFIIFGIWFMLVGVNYLDRNGAVKVITTLACAVVELIPYIDMVPAITFGVVSLVLITRAEDGKPSMLFGLAANRKAAMNDEEKLSAQMRADARIRRDAKTTASLMVRGSQPRNTAPSEEDGQ